jgi:hypothetical protein
MAEVRGYFKSDFYDESYILRSPIDDPEKLKFFGVFVYHDIHNLKLTVGLSISEQKGVRIYQQSGISKDPVEAFSNMSDAIEPHNIISSTRPFFHSEGIPIKLDSGEPGVLTIVHLPLVRLRPVLKMQD